MTHHGTCLPLPYVAKPVENEHRRRPRTPSHSTTQAARLAACVLHRAAGLTPARWSFPPIRAMAAASGTTAPEVAAAASAEAPSWDGQASQDELMHKDCCAVVDARDADHDGLAQQRGQRGRTVRHLGIRVHVRPEDVLPAHAAARPRLEAREVDLPLGEAAQAAVQAPR